MDLKKLDRVALWVVVTLGIIAGAVGTIYFLIWLILAPLRYGSF